MPFGNLKLNDGNEVSSDQNNVGKTDIEQVYVQIPAIAFGTGSRWYEKVRERVSDTPSFTLDLTVRTGCTGLCRTGDRERFFSH